MDGQPKKQRSVDMSTQNMDEINAYCMISTRLVDLLAEGKRDIARSNITQILLLWHNSRQGGLTARISAQQMRSHRFVAALEVLAAPQSVHRLDPQYHFGDMDLEDEEDLLLGFNSHTSGKFPLLLPVTCSFACYPALSCLGVWCGSGACNGGGNNADGASDASAVPAMGRIHSLEVDFLDLPVAKKQRGTSRSSDQDDDSSEGLSMAGHSYSAGSLTVSGLPPHFHPPLQVMRLVRMSDSAWAVTVNKVYHLEKVLSHVAGDVFLVDEKMFSPDEWRGMKITRRCLQGNACIEAELAARNLLVAQWSRKDHEQLVYLVSSWTHTINQRYQQSQIPAARSGGSSSTPPGEHIPSLIAYWCVGALSMPCRLNSFGALAYEEVAREGLVIRSNDVMGLEEDVWNLHYVQAFAQTTSEKESFLDLLLGFFPQLNRIVCRQSRPAGDGPVTAPFSADMVVVKYACHKGVTLEDEAGVTHVPAKLYSAAYQTLGLLTSPADIIPSRCAVIVAIPQLYHTVYCLTWIYGILCSGSGCFHDIVLTLNI